MYNWALSTRKTAYFQHDQNLTYNALSAMLTNLKKEYRWLCDVSSVPLQQTLRNLDRAFINFKAKYPKFKKKHGTQSATYASNAFTMDGQTLILAKMDEPLDIHWHRPRPLDSKLTHAMIVSMSCKIFHWTCANGFVQSAADSMTGISMQQKIFWPRGSRCRPVEEVSDPNGRKLVELLPVKQEHPIR